MKTVYTYYKNSNTGHLMMAQEFTETQIKGIPINYYDINKKRLGENLSIDGYVIISEKKFNRESKKQKNMAQSNYWNFFKDNKKDEIFRITPEELKSKYLKWLKTKEKAWLEYYGFNIQSMYAFFGDSEEIKGLQSVSVLEDGQEQWEALRTTRANYFKELGIK